MKKWFKKMKWNRIVFILMLILIITFLGYIGFTNILPLKYFLLLSVVFILWILILFFLLVFKVKKKSIRKKIGYGLTVFLLILMGIIFHYLSTTMSFFGGFGDNKYKEENYLLLVLNTTSYEKVEDLKDKKVGYVQNELGKIKEALEELTKKISYQEEKYTQYDTMIQELKQQKIDSILVEESYLSILEENEYKGIFKTIYKITIRSMITDVSKEVNVTNTPFSIYISGIDSYGSISGVSRSDVNMVVTVNPTTKQILLISVPRDYYVQLRGTTGYKDKLTHAGIYGIETSVGTLEDLLQMDINYYFRVNFTTVETVVDALGGIDVYSEYNFTSSPESGGTYRFTKGYNHLNGNQALAFSRERHNVKGGDRTRGINQQAVMDGLVRKVTSSAIITKYSKLMNDLKNTFQTNMTEKDILSLIKMQLNDMAKWNITSYSLDGSDSLEFTYSYQHQKLYVMIPNTDTVNHGIELVHNVKDGKVLDSSYGKVENIKDPTPVVIPQPSVPETPVEPIEEPITEPTEPEKGDNPLVPDIIPEEPIDEPTELGNEEPTEPQEPDPREPEENESTEENEE